jgi:outer membrane protein OmpA-like peptidoglycan-associated protein
VLEGTIRWEDAESHAITAFTHSDSSGYFFAVLPVGRRYAYVASNAGYISQVDTIDVAPLHSFTRRHLDITLSRIPGADEPAGAPFLADSEQVAEAQEVERLIRALPQPDTATKKETPIPAADTLGAEAPPPAPPPPETTVSIDTSTPPPEPESVSVRDSSVSVRVEPAPLPDTVEVSHHEVLINTPTDSAAPIAPPETTTVAAVNVPADSTPSIAAVPTEPPPPDTARPVAPSPTAEAESEIPEQIEPPPDAPAPEIVLHNIYFETDESELLPESMPELERLRAILEAHSRVRIRIQGYTDTTGAPARNRALSRERARAVRSYLVSRGIRSWRLTAAGYGASHPIASNETEEGRRQNRRVAFVVRAAASSSNGSRENSAHH